MWAHKQMHTRMRAHTHAHMSVHTCTDTHVKGGGAHPGHSHLTQGLSDVQRGQTEEEREQERWHFPMLHKPGGKCGDRAI